ncbi:hypothetical protein ACFXPS_38555 [Nocardia sp. NPDC059091]|uniref:hypothetical protein n=1 Tax=unclassified Nocardia TaxID=2637762 RepID=UPI003681EEFC
MDGGLGIEYAHIYTDQQFSAQHKQSIEELHKLPADTDSVRIVLVDDYSTGLPVGRFDMEEFLSRLSRHNALPDVVVLESTLSPFCPLVVDLIGDSKLKRKIIGYHRTRGRYPCSLLVATWYLLRLGFFGNPDVPCVYGTAEKLYTDRILTILPDCFMTPETDALEIIRETGNLSMIQNIEHIFFEYQRDGYSHWDDFDAKEYVERNYGREILSEDRQIIEFVMSALKELDIEPGSKHSVADVCAGPNLYPALMLSPFISSKGTLELIDIAPGNLNYLRQVLTGHDSELLSTWRRFEDYIRSLGQSADLQKILNTSLVKSGSIYELESNSYDAVLSFFGADSITDEEGQFDKATASLMSSVRPNGLFIVAHMIGSRGYFAGEDTFFPAINFNMEQIRQKYDEYGSCMYRLVGRGDQVQARKGYKGMAVVVGRKEKY